MLDKSCGHHCVYNALDIRAPTERHCSCPECHGRPDRNDPDSTCPHGYHFGGTYCEEGCNA